MGLKEELQKIREQLSKSTQVRKWYAHSDEDGKGATVRGPFCRWFRVTAVSPEYKKHVASDYDDAQYAALAMNELPKLLACVERLVMGYEKILDSASGPISYETFSTISENAARDSLESASAILTGSNEKEK